MLFFYTKIITRTIVYLFLAVFFFLYLVNFLQIPNISPAINLESNTALYNIDKVEKDTNVMLNKLSSLEDNRETLRLKKYFGIVEKSDNNEEIMKSISLFYKSFIFFEYVFYNNNFVIPCIYVLIVITFLLQALLLAWSHYYSDLLSFWNEKKLDSIFLYCSEWAVNSPPVLGVVGTIFSFAIVVSNLSNMSSLSTVFKDNFSNAALTTIIGGSIYVLNLYMNIFITKNLVHN